MSVLALGWAFAAPLAGQETAPNAAAVESATAPAQESAEGEATAGFQAGTARLNVEGRVSSLPYTRTLTGDVFALRPLAERLGGELREGPLRLSQTLDLFGTEVVIGADSPVMTIGERIVPLSRTPLAGIGGLMVPMDFLRKTWGEQGYVFTWSPSARELSVQRRAGRRLDASLDLVHIAGVTTLVMRFTEEPSYRFERTEDGFELVFPGDELSLLGPMPRPAELVRAIEIDQDRVRVRVAPGAEAAEPYRVDRGQIQIITDVARGRGFATPPSRSTPASPQVATPRPDGGEMRIVLDPGHGGEEVGAVGTAGTLEKDLTLQLARRLRRQLEARLPVRVLMTRDGDVAVDHESRTAVANQNAADLFISLHINSVPGGGGVGAETYFLDIDASDRSAAEAARIENGEDADTNPVQLMLWDLAQSRHMEDSQTFARLVQRELNEELGLRDRGVKQAPFRVLVGAQMPAVLVEFGFLSNPDEESKLLDGTYQSDLVEAVVRAVVEFRERRSGAAAEPPSAEDPR